MGYANTSYPFPPETLGDNPSPAEYDTQPQTGDAIPKQPAFISIQVPNNMIIVSLEAQSSPPPRRKGGH